MTSNLITDLSGNGMGVASTALGTRRAQRLQESKTIHPYRDFDIRGLQSTTNEDDAWKAMLAEASRTRNPIVLDPSVEAYPLLKALRVPSNVFMDMQGVPIWNQNIALHPQQQECAFQLGTTHPVYYNPEWSNAYSHAPTHVAIEGPTYIGQTVIQFSSSAEAARFAAVDTISIRGSTYILNAINPNLRYYYFVQSNRVVDFDLDAATVTLKYGLQDIVADPYVFSFDLEETLDILQDQPVYVMRDTTIINGACITNYGTAFNRGAAIDCFVEMNHVEAPTGSGPANSFCHSYFRAKKTITSIKGMEIAANSHNSILIHDEVITKPYAESIEPLIKLGEQPRNLLVKVGLLSGEGMATDDDGTPIATSSDLVYIADGRNNTVIVDEVRGGWAAGACVTIGNSEVASPDFVSAEQPGLAVDNTVRIGTLNGANLTRFARLGVTAARNTIHCPKDMRTANYGSNNNAVQVEGPDNEFIGLDMDYGYIRLLDARAINCRFDGYVANGIHPSSEAAAVNTAILSRLETSVSRIAARVNRFARKVQSSTTARNDLTPTSRFSLAIPANVLVTNGHGVEFKVTAILAGTTGTKTITLTAGGTTAATEAFIAALAETVNMRIRAYRVNDTQIRVACEIIGTTFGQKVGVVTVNVSSLVANELAFELNLSVGDAGSNITLLNVETLPITGSLF